MIAARTASTRDSMTDRVAQARVMRVWNVPQYSAPEVQQLQLFAQVLGGSRSSRLDQRLFHGDKSVDRISASMDASELGGIFDITVDIKAGVDPATVEKAIEEELQRLLREGPTAAELEQARTVFKASFVRGIERIGGFGGKADALAECTVYTGDPGCFREQLHRIATVTPAQVQAAGNKWLRAGDHMLTVLPGEVTPVVEEPSVNDGKPVVIPPADPTFKTVASDLDRAAGVPLASDFPELKFPALQRATLKNGIKVILAERHDTPVVQMSLEFPGGFSSDRGRKAGTASFAMGMLDEGAGNYDAIALGNRQEQLGAIVAATASLDAAEVSLSALKENLAPSIALWADVIRRPRFEAAEIERVKANWLATIKQEKTQPSAMAMRVLGPLMYGSNHPYAIPFTGSGFEADIATLDRNDLLALHEEQVRPDTATVMVVGDTTLAEIVPLLEQQLGNWSAPQRAHTSGAMPAVALPAKPRVFLVDQPGAIQANIIAAQLLPSSTDAATVDLEIANAVFGGDFTSRLNMNLREDKQLVLRRAFQRRELARASGRGSRSRRCRSTRPWMSIKEIQREIGDFTAGRRAVNEEEVTRLQAINIRSLPGSFETGRNVLATIGSINRYDRPDDFVTWRKGRIEKMTPAGVQQVASSAFKSDALTWIVVGDLSKIEAGIRELKLGEVHGARRRRQGAEVSARARLVLAADSARSSLPAAPS